MRIDRKYMQRFEVILDPLRKKSSVKKVDERILLYLRLYTHIVGAFNLIRKDTVGLFFDHMQTIMDNIDSSKSYREGKYLENIRETVSGILKNRKKIEKLLKTTDDPDPLHIRTKLAGSQNICLLRILDISVK